MKSVTEKSMDYNKRIKINFEGGNLTSDAGLLLYKEFDEKIGFSQTIRQMLKIKDPVSHHTHTNEDVMIQKIYQHLVGYHTDDHADELKNEPVFTTILEKERLASQPTLSRLNQKFDKEAMKQLQSINRILLDRIIHKIQPADSFVWDLDSSNFATYGQQHGAAFNSHYQTNGYHPLFMFDGLTGDCIKGELRSGNVYTSRQVVRFVGPEIKRFKKKCPGATICIRADSGFAVPELYELAETHGVNYVIRLKANARLKAKAQEIEETLREQYDLNTTERKVFYKEFLYQAARWNQPRRVVVKIEKPEGELFSIYTFIVTNLKLSPKNIVMFYQNRGTMENFIKEGKYGFAFDHMNSSDFYINACKFQLAILAYNFHNWFRRLCLPKKLKTNRIETLRTKLIKIAGKIVNTGRYTIFKLCSSCLYQQAFWKTIHKIQQLPGFL
ncbi:IS1380 family transposase [Aneurinibacillus tyrosinisolvens]|uniref:IS1380 family transposase n=1 Tax=Aneurinibacillus tyrosinisolvens TaxID=1443435 RepID=UPI00063F9072|nr:IS1380 family transposase [Aneurinibacillus tyrosinisolvens]